MARMLMVGKTSAGKTTLIQALHNESIHYIKTQTANFYKDVIDLPGEYLENPRFYNAIVTLSVEVDVIALVQDATSELSYFPPHFADMFNKKIIGIITKIDLVDEKELSRAHRYLRQAGAKKIFEVSIYDELSITIFKKQLYALR